MPKYRKQELAAEAIRRSREQTARLGGASGKFASAAD